MSRIFLSHSSEDDFEAVALRDWLAGEGWEDVFLDLDPDRGIAAGERWERALHEAARRCEAVVFVISNHWLASHWCRKEYNLASRLNKKLFAVLVDKTTSVDNLPHELSDTWQVTDLAGGRDGEIFRAVHPDSQEERQICFSRDGLRRLRRGLQKAGLDARFFPWPPPNDPNRAPFRGLKALEAADAGIFFGRDAPIVEATDRLRGLAAGAAPRLFVVLGASGAGKSSFLQAGLLPRLARDDAVFVPLAPIRPGRAALHGETGLLRALEIAFPGHTRAQLREAMAAGALGLRLLLAALVEEAFERTLAERTSRKPATIVIAVDQAEELFRPDGAAEGTALLSMLRDLTTTDNPAVIVIFAIRSDSYDALEHAKPLEGLDQNTLPLLPLPQGAYQELIEGPARRSSRGGKKLVIAPQLTARLLDDIEAGPGSDALPLLAFTLAQLYEEYHQAQSLRLSDYEAIGGLRGAIEASIARVFARAGCSPLVPHERATQEALLRKGMIPWLCGIDPDSRSPRRNIATRTDIPPESLPLIDLLIEERLLSSDSVEAKDPATGEATSIVTIEPTHEALLRQWDLLQRWLAENFALLVALEGLKRAAREWNTNERTDGWLSHQGDRLAEVQALDDYPDIAAKLDAVDRAYLVACGRHKDAIRAAAETRRKEREQEQARQLEDAQVIATSAKRAKIGLVAALVLLVAALGIAAIAVKAKLEAQNQTQNAKLARLAGTRTANDLIFDVAKNSRNDAASKGMARSVVDLALKLQDDLIGKTETDTDLLHWRGETLGQTARILQSFGEPREALKAAATSRDTFLFLSKQDPSDRTRSRDLATSHDLIGTLEEPLDTANAVASYRAEIEIRRHLAEDPTDPGALRELAASLRTLAEIEVNAGDSSEGFAQYDSALKALAAIPTDLRHGGPRHDTVAILEEIADTKERLGDVAGAFASARKASALDIEIGGADAAPRQTREIIAGLDRAADLASKLAADQDALANREESLRRRRELAASGDEIARHDLLAALLATARLKSRMGDNASALALYRESVVQGRTFREDARDRQAKKDVAAALDGMGWTEMSLADPHAIDSFKQGAEIRQALAATRSAKPDAKRDWAISLAHLAYADRSAKQFDDASKNLETSLSIRQALAHDEPAAKRAAETVGPTEAIGSLAYDLVKNRRFDAALDAADKAIAAAPNLVLAHLNRAHALMYLHRVGEATAVHLAHRTEHLADGSPWQAAALADFADLRQSGLASPVMDQIAEALTDRQTHR